MAENLLTASAQTKADPPKAKKKNRKWRVPVRLKFTREGKYFFWMTIGVGLAAINTGNNLLYLLLGMMLSLIVISGILCNISLSKLAVERTIPSEIFAGTPCLVSLSVRNKKRFFPSFSIEIEDRIEYLPKGKKCYFLKISPGSSQQTAYRLTLPRRGRYELDEVRVSTRFPFALFTKTRILSVPGEMIAYPRITPIALPAGDALKQTGWDASMQRGQGIDFFALRDMQPGDELRWVHWPSTARLGTFQVREFTDDQRPQVDMMVWQEMPEGIDHAEERLDPAVDMAASLLLAFVQREQPVRLATATHQFPPVDHPSRLADILLHLALLSPQEALAKPSWLDDFPLVVLSEDSSPPAGVDPARFVVAYFSEEGAVLEPTPS
ncbi:MAG: DUF58 domain-containing protein [Deltaproteobacteria bacterium]|nr:MAG: DUF58 domain-containing protein [Deltaproteobacteria bacterium]